MLYTTLTGHILDIDVGTPGSAGAWSVYEFRDGARAMIGTGMAAFDDADAAAQAASDFCLRYEATEALVMNALADMERDAGPLTDDTVRNHFAALLAGFPDATAKRE
jgi:hypothetical protein